MPRPLFGPDRQGISLDRAPAVRASTGTGTGVLTTARSERYRAAVRRLDASATLSPVELQEVVEELRREFEEKWAALPLGLVAHCYLGPPFEAHTLTVDHQIIEHYKSGQALPGPLEAARSLARTEHYLTIEVYGDRLVCVRPDGSVVTVGC